MTNLVESARLFATAAHSAVGQLRKYTFEPYIVHPVEVAKIVKSTNYCTEEMIAAALLHDVLEDTNVSEEVLRFEFGNTVTDMVVWLTNVSQPKDGNRSVRKELDRQNLAKAPGEVHTIKLADLLSNTPSIIKYDNKFAKIYIPEKEALLEVLTKGDPYLLHSAKQMINHAKYDLIN